MADRNLYYVGPSVVANSLAQHLGDDVKCGWPSRPAAGDVVFLSVRMPGELAGDCPGGNAFTACRTLKEDPQIRVFLLIDPGDRFAAETARFCLADGCVEVGGDGSIGDFHAVEAILDGRPKGAPIDQLLAQLERDLLADSGSGSALQGVLGQQRPETMIDLLTDSATGLFAGPYAALKLEEEFKRALRFHQPLSLLLIDVGGSDERAATSPERQDACIAEVAAVFLSECRDVDLPARFTDTTFLFLLPGTGAAGAAVVARRILGELQRRVFSGGESRTPHAGLATVPAAGITHRAGFLARAEACLRLAQQGRGSGGLCVSCE